MPDRAGSQRQVRAGTTRACCYDNRMRWRVAVFAASLLFGCSASGGGSSGTPGGDASVGPTGCDSSHDTCPSAQHCSVTSHTCEPGCRADDGCPEAKPHCDVAHHTCVVCLSADQCPAGQACSDQTCVPSCSSSHPCAGTATCCAEACVDVQSSPANCGKCGATCTLAHASSVCKAGGCAIGDCIDGFADCNGVAADGCETDLTKDPASCGKCGFACTGTHGKASCVAASCVLSCDPGWGDCDHNPANGCEADLAHDPKNCGGCGVAPTEVCNGRDDNCNGSVDETFACVKGSAPRSCTASCGSAGSQACNADCSLAACAPPAETCNLVDDDCNGVCDDVSGCRVGVNRSYNGATGEHFYTTDATEAACCGFIVEFPNYYYLYSSNVGAGLTQLYRCWVSAYARHFYTTASDCEGNTVEGAMGWLATGATCGATPLYRLYNPTNNDHFYTTSASEKDSAVAGGYTFEAIIGYVWTAPSG